MMVTYEITATVAEAVSALSKSIFWFTRYDQTPFRMTEVLPFRCAIGCGSGARRDVQGYGTTASEVSSTA